MKQYKLTKRGQKVKSVMELAWAGVVGGGFSYMVFMACFG